MLSSHRGFPRSSFTFGLAGLLAVVLFALSPPGRGAAVVSTPGGIGAAYVAPAPAIEVIFRFEVVDLADTTPGQDLWEYSYVVSGLTLTANQGFTIFFDLSLYTLLQNPPPFVNADFSLLVAQPDLALNSNGFYDALALRDNPSFADPFKLRVVWLGTGSTTPGAQPYTVYNADFTTQSQGQTTNVPEPSALALVCSGIALASMRVRRRTPGSARVSRAGRGVPPRRTSKDVRNTGRDHLHCDSRPRKSVPAGRRHQHSGRARSPELTAALFLFLLIFLPAANAQLVIGPPETVTETRITRTVFEYVMRAKITNPGPAAAAISATVTSSSPKTVIVQNTLTFGNVGALTTADSTGTFTLRHDRTVPFNPAVLHWTIKQPFIVSAATPTAGASEVGVTVRPQVFFSKTVDPATLNANNFFAKGPDGQKLPATIVPANDATFAWLFFAAPMAGASQEQVTVDGATIRLAGGADLLDAANNGTPGSKLTFDFSTVSLAPLANTTVWGRIVDPGPDLLPYTANDSLPGPDRLPMTEDDIHLLPIAGVKGLSHRLGKPSRRNRCRRRGGGAQNKWRQVKGRAASRSTASLREM